MSETFGELFRDQRDDLMALTLWKKVFDIIRRIMKTLADLIDISADELLDNISRDEKHQSCNSSKYGER